MSRLPPLPEFARLSDRVWRVMGLNPGRWTLQGTNTYLVGRGARKVLIDCGAGRPEYLPLLIQSLKTISEDCFISDIYLSHCHSDHWGGVEQILTSPLSKPNVHKFPLPPGGKDETSFMGSFPWSLVKLTPLEDNQIIKVDPNTTLHVLHTPGHANDHCAFWFEEEQSIFTADCILGHGSVIFSDLSEYMASLKKMEALVPKRLYPGHGTMIENGPAKIKEYINVRKQREDQIVRIMHSDTKKQSWTIGDLVQAIYGFEGDMMMEYTVSLHLTKLEKDGRVVQSREANDADSDIKNVQWLYTGSLL
ncbi:Metallo-hydrolase/oxidoreductase [Phycomyces blakesleeanus]|uniref:Metallo-hydrolase/oxidoreductase n=1 Tax=Phycomyces blakesleeanus TaxID=4837 RepID=A0ABR3AHL4_PHYBL